ncbi:MAG TPA: glutamate--tRNA ligase [Patescibacteria group bacterium]|jgi:glutamyl-tRNA synthetase|nr:glutamate--tRNA ligase [Patescibacteria group bacterium]
MNNNTPIRVRFAPSPTGHLHVGGLRTALFNYLFAKHVSGIYLLRCEDTDTERSSKDFFASQMSSLAWVGIMPDEPVVIQSSRFDEHKKIINKLLSEKKAYKCFCTEQDLKERLGREENNATFIRYDRHCFYNQSDKKRSYVIRFCMPEIPDMYKFHDLIRGVVSFTPDQYDDFIIVRSDNVPVYNLVVVIDDAFMNISHVIRGEEHISNTPKQIALYHACGFTIPKFAHLPMILSANGQKLSKRDGAVSVNEYKEMGYLPHALINYLARLGWAHGDQELFSMKELIACFSLQEVGKKGAIFDKAKLDWINSIYIRATDAAQLYVYMQETLHYNFVVAYPAWDRCLVERAINIFKERVATLRDLLREIESFYKGPMLEIAHVTSPMRYYARVVREIFLKEGVALTNIKNIAKEIGVPMVAIAQSVRFALLGKIDGPGVGDLLAILSKQEILQRLERLETI